MKSKLLLFPTSGMSAEDWLKFRKRGIGASEVGTILGLNPYKCSAQLFYEKAGEDIGLNTENMAMFMGKAQENFIANLWQYWDGDEATMMQNYRENKIVRRCQRVNAYVTNPDYPWLFVSLDRKINKAHEIHGHFRAGVGFVGLEGALELKTIAGYEADKWESGIPPSHVVQVQTQLLVCEFSYGELAILRDGRSLEVFPFDYKPSICETIIERTKVFWDKVEKARQLVTKRFEAQRTFNYKAVEEIGEELSTLEPAPDGSEAFANYLKERYRIAEPGLQAGEDIHRGWALMDLEYSKQIKELEGSRLLMQNRLKAVLRDGADKLTFGENGYVSWKADSNGVRRFLNKIKATE